MAQPPGRPWFRLASILQAPPPPSRPPAPAPVQQQTIRPPVALPQATQATAPPPAPAAAFIPPRTSAPPSPIPPTTPAPMSSPVASPPPRDTSPQSPTSPSPPPPQSTSPPSPAKTPPATLTSPATQPPTSPAKTGGSQPASSTARSPTTTSAPSPPPPISSKPTSPITKTSSSLPASPGQKASPKTAATRPDVTYSARPPSPSPTTPAFQTVPSSPAPPQPSPVPTTAPIATMTNRRTTPIVSPKIDKPWVETPPQSGKEKLLSHPPSPLTLPPAQLKAGSDLEPIPAEVEQKTVLLQETEEKSKMTPKTSSGQQQRSHGEAHNHTIAQNGKRELKKDKGVHTHKKHSDSEESGIMVVTLAGENKGAIMEWSPSRKKYGSAAWSNGGQKLKSSNDEGSLKTKDEKHKAAETETAPVDAFINCNVQGVNNSLLYNSCFTHNDPGVHLSVSRKGKGGRGVHHMKDSVIG